MDIYEPRRSVRTIVLENLKTPFHIYRWIIQFNQFLILNLISFNLLLKLVFQIYLDIFADLLYKL